MKLVINLMPFVRQQSAYLINDNNEIQKEETFVMEDINSFIFSHDNLKEVTFHGNKHYLDRFVQRAKEIELSKYNQNTIKFTID